MVKFLKHSVKPLDNDQIEQVDAEFKLKVVQQPVKARVAGRKQTRNSSRRLVDPQPVVEICLDDYQNDSSKNIIDHSLSMFFVRASIECLGCTGKESFFQKQRKSRFFEKDEEESDVLRGTTAVSAQFYRGSPYVACAVFDNLSVRYKGHYKLKFDLFEIKCFPRGTGVIPEVIHWTKASTQSSVFTVYTDAAFDGLEASPELNNELKKAGCKIRARKQRNFAGGFDLEGFKIGKNSTYNNGQVRYALTGTNHFGLNQDTLNRPGTSVDVSMFHNFQSPVPFTYMQNQKQPSNTFPTNSNIMTPVKRPQSALPHLVTSSEQLDLSNSYNDMLRSAIKSEYSLSPLERPQPRRVVTTNSALSTPIATYPHDDNLYPNLLANLNMNGPLASVSASPSSGQGAGGISSPDEFLSPVSCPNANNGFALLAAQVDNNSIIESRSLPNGAGFNDQYALNGSQNSLLTTTAQMAGINPNGSPLGHTFDSIVPVNTNGTINASLGLDNVDIPRSTIPLDPIPIFWDFDNNNNNGNNTITTNNNNNNETHNGSTNSYNVNQYDIVINASTYQGNGTEGTSTTDNRADSNIVGFTSQQQQQQLQSLQAQLKQNYPQYSHSQNFVGDGGNSDFVAQDQLRHQQQPLKHQQHHQQMSLGVQNDFNSELFNLNDLYQQSEMLLHQNFQI